MRKRVLYIGHDNEGSLEIIAKSIKQNPKTENFVVITQGILYKKNIFQSILFLIRHASFQFCLQRFIEMLEYKFKSENLIKFCINNDVPFLSTSDLNSEITINTIMDFNPHLLVSTFTTHKVSSRLRQIPLYGSIGTHPSRIPSYRGFEVFFWMLANNETSTAISVFELTDSIDNGPLISQFEFSIDSKDSVKSLYKKLTFHTADLVSHTIAKIVEVEQILTIDNPEKNSSYYPMPTREAYRLFRKNNRRWGWLRN